MIKKFAAILIFSLACVLQLGHSIVPHSHADEHHHGHEKQHHHGDNDSEDRNIFNFFSHYGPTAEVFNSKTEDVQISNVRESYVEKSDYDHFTSTQCFSAKPLLTSFDEPLIYISPHLVSRQFRGPPTV